MGQSRSRLWRWAAAVGVVGLLLLMGGILIADRWEDMFGVAVFVGLACTWVALLLLAGAWARELWYSFRGKDYLTALLWLAVGLLVLVLSGRHIFF